MKTSHVIAAFFFSVLILTGTKAYRYYVDRPLQITSRSGVYSLTHVPVHRHAGMDTSPFFTARFEGPPPEVVKVQIYYKSVFEEENAVPENFVKLPMPLGEEAIDEYDVFLPPYAAGSTIEYYITAETEEGDVLVSLPSDGPESGEVLRLDFQGIVPAWARVLDIAFSSVALLCLMLFVFNFICSQGSVGDWKLVASQAIWACVFVVTGFGGAQALESHFRKESWAYSAWPLTNPKLALGATCICAISTIAFHLWAKRKSARQTPDQTETPGTVSRVIVFFISLLAVAQAISAFND